MNGNRFYSVPFDARNDVSMKVLRSKCGGMAAFGRWQALLGMLYDQDGVIDLSDETMRLVVSEELELSEEGLADFIGTCASLKLVDNSLWTESAHVVNKGVCDEIEYRNSKSYAGKKSAERRSEKVKR